MEKLKRSIWGKIKTGLKYGFLAGLVFHVASNFAYLTNEFYQAIKPSSYRVAFEEKFGFPLKGWTKSIEGNPRNVAMIARALEREKESGDFTLSSIRIRDENYLKKPIWDQAYSIVMTPNVGYCEKDWVVLGEKECYERELITHECKHAKTFDIIAKNPEFLEKWEALAKDKSGNSLYLSKAERFCSRVRGLGSLVDKKKQCSIENEKLGFVSNYARTNVLEDIAELCEMAETNRLSLSLSNLVSKKYDETNDIIAKKLALAEEYKLIPKNFNRVVEIERLFENCAKPCGGMWGVDQEKAKSFMEASEKFLKENPDGIYESELRSTRANVFYQGVFHYPNPVNSMEDAIKECKKVLNSKYKEEISYCTALGKLSEIYKDNLNDEKTAKIFGDAGKEYFRRLDGGDINLTTRGVNDFLAENGISLH